MCVVAFWWDGWRNWGAWWDCSGLVHSGRCGLRVLASVSHAVGPRFRASRRRRLRGLAVYRAISCMSALPRDFTGLLSGFGTAGYGPSRDLGPNRAVLVGGTVLGMSLLCRRSVWAVLFWPIYFGNGYFGMFWADLGTWPFGFVGLDFGARCARFGAFWHHGLTGPPQDIRPFHAMGMLGSWLVVWLYWGESAEFWAQRYRGVFRQVLVPSVFVARSCIGGIWGRVVAVMARCLGAGYVGWVWCGTRGILVTRTSSILVSGRGVEG